MKARTGKIARLPKAVRDRLNERLAGGEQGEPLLEWLHGLPEVLEVLVRDFEGRLILKQNLSDWRKGGFRDWEARQERLEQVRLITEEAEDTQAAAPELADRMAALLAGRFASLIANTAHVKDWSKPRQRAQLMEMCEGVASLRRFDQGGKRLDLEREQLEMKKAELELAREAQTKRTHAQWREWTRAEMDRILNSSQTPEQVVSGLLILLHGHADEEMIEQEFARNRMQAGLQPLPEDATLLEKTESLMQTHAIAEKIRKGEPQESQGQSNPVKP
ncbi:MAG: hypothetical protein R3F13_13365 [Prosthecobacter sp.]